MIEGMGINTGINMEKLMQAAFKAAELLPVPLSSRMVSAEKCAIHFD